jgi:hypothetical protein
VRKQANPNSSLIDRFAVAFLSSLVCFLSCLAIWFIAFAMFAYIIPIKLIMVISLFSALLGFLSLENVVLKILAPIWHAIDDVFNSHE